MNKVVLVSALLVVLGPYAHSACGQSNAHTHADSIAIARKTQLVTDSLLHAIAADVANARALPALVPYTIDLPSDRESIEWGTVRRSLFSALRAREAVPQDTIVRTLSVEIQRTSPSFLMLRVVSGVKWRCGPGWLDRSSGRSITVPLGEGEPLPIHAELITSHSLPCPGSLRRSAADTARSP